MSIDGNKSIKDIMKEEQKEYKERKVKESDTNDKATSILIEAIEQKVKSLEDNNINNIKPKIEQWLSENLNNVLESKKL